MTLKSPFYNKPSTSTSVDSCHKCPAISPMTTKDFNVPDKESAKNLKVSQVQSNDQQDRSFGFDHRLTETSNNNNNKTNVIEPCNSRVTKLDNGNHSLTSCSNCGTTSTPLWRRSPQGETICNACGLYLKARNTTRPPWLKRNANNKRPNAPSMPVALAPAPIAMKLPIHTLPNLIPIQKMPMTATSSNNNNNNTMTNINHHPTSTSSSSSENKKENNDHDHDLDKSTTDGNRNMICFNCNTNTTPLWRRDGDGNTICNACGLYYKLHNVHRPITMKRSIIKRRKRVAIPATMTTSNVSTTTTIATINHHQQQEMIGMKRKSSMDHHDIENEQPIKRMELPLLAAKLSSTSNTLSSSDNVKPIEPDAFQYRHHLPSPPLQPIKSSNLANLLNPSTNDDDDQQEKEKQSFQLPSISLPSLPSPPLIAYDHHQQRRSISLSPPPMSPGSTSSSSSSSSDQHLYESNNNNSNNNNNNNAVAAAAAAAFATVSALLNPKANRHQTHKMLEAHRHELQREVSNLTSMLSRTTAMLENLDQVMAVTSNRDN
ncbi:unnamed protein product [Cunninghamella blakesleeana]